MGSTERLPDCQASNGSAEYPVKEVILLLMVLNSEDPYGGKGRRPIAI